MKPPTLAQIIAQFMQEEVIQTIKLSKLKW